LELSKLRAASVVAWLRKHGVDDTLLFPIGVGSLRRISQDIFCESSASQNMRVEIAFMPLMG